MRKPLRFLPLIPVAVLLALLPRQLRGDLPYHVSMASYVLSLIIWLLLFCGMLAISHRSRWSRLIFVLIALEIVSGAGYSLWTGKSGLIVFLVQVVGVCVLMDYAWIASPPIRKRIANDDAS